MCEKKRFIILTNKTRFDHVSEQIKNVYSIIVCLIFTGLEIILRKILLFLKIEFFLMITLKKVKEQKST